MTQGHAFNPFFRMAAALAAASTAVPPLRRDHSGLTGYRNNTGRTVARDQRAARKARNQRRARR